MNKKLIKFLMLMAYCIPYGYLAMNGDATSGTTSTNSDNV